MDELSYEVGIDPLKLREVNFTAKDEATGKELTSKDLLSCYAQGAAAIGWQRRKLARSRRLATPVVSVLRRASALVEPEGTGETSSTDNL